MWLCERHQKKSRVTVLQDTDLDTADPSQEEEVMEEDADDSKDDPQPEEATESELPEVTLLTALRQLTDDEGKLEPGLEEVAADDKQLSSLIDQTGELQNRDIDLEKMLISFSLALPNLCLIICLLHLILVCVQV